MKLWTICAIAAVGLLSLGESFVVRSGSPPRTTSILMAGHYGDDGDSSSSSSQQREDEKSNIPPLPYFGASTQSTFNPLDGTLPNILPKNNNDSDDDAQQRPYVAGRRKMELQYTCNICETRNCHKVSRIAYRKGVVIATCKGCGSQHLISDNLGFTNLWKEDEGTTIEEYFSKQGMEDKVNRVSKDVFDLEKVLGHDSDSGSILGENGDLALE